MNTEIGGNTKAVKVKNKFFGISTIIAVPALLVFFIFCVIPFISSLINAFKAFSPMKGLVNSPWVGFKNFQEFFSSAYGLNIISNAFIINSLVIVFGGIYVFLLTLGIASIKNKWIKAIVISLTILPALVPAPVMISSLLQSDFLRSNIFQNPSYYRISVIANEIFCIAPIAVLAGTFACLGRFSLKKVLFVSIGFITIRFMLLFSSDLNYIISSYNPLVYKTGDVIGTLIYRKGLLGAAYSSASTTYIVKNMLQLFPAIIGTISIILMSKKMESNNEIIETANSGSIFSIISLIPACIFVWVAMSTVSGINIFTNEVAVNGLLNSLVLSILSSVFFIMLSICLAYGIVVGNKFVLIMNSLFILLGGNFIGQYLFFRSLGLVNTYPSIIVLNSLYAPIGAYFIYFALGGINKLTFENFFRKSIPIMAVMLGVGFARFYSSYVEPMIYLRDRKTFPVSLVLREILLTGNGGQRIQVSTITLLLIPVIIGIASVWAGIITADKQNKKENAEETK